MEYPKKLIEVALPLDDINVASTREKSIRHGHPSTLHLWWARRPLAAARAVLFAQLVNDPGGKRGYGKFKGQTKEDAQKERDRLFDIIRELVKWENINNEELLNEARTEIYKSWKETCEITGEDPNKMPPFLDPFAGGGAIPLEAQRLGLEAYASDLNPVAVMINKAMIEIPPKFVGRAPVCPTPKEERQTKIDNNWSGSRGLAEDVRRYGAWMRDEAEKKIGHLYPTVDLPKAYGGGKATVIAWLWARTVKCPNPACGAQMTLINSLDLSVNKGKHFSLEHKIDKSTTPYKIIFEIKKAKSKEGEAPKVGRGAAFKCLACQQIAGDKAIRAEFQAKRCGVQLIAIVAEGSKGRCYLPSNLENINIAKQAKPLWKPDQTMNQDCKDLVSGRGYGITHWHELFTSRQLVALTTFADLVKEVRKKVIDDARKSGWKDDGVGLNNKGTGPTAYGDALSVYLAFAIDKMADRGSTICSWDSSRDSTRNTFGRQAIPMTWDFAEANPFSESTGNFNGGIEWAVAVIKNFSISIPGNAFNRDATMNFDIEKPIISTDPPYFDNISYADLSDFFYIWLRPVLKFIFPDIFSTMLVPKAEELIAAVYRHGNKQNAEIFFMNGMTNAVKNIARNSHSAFPVSIYYAFKQSETKEEGTSSSGWETFLEAVLKSGFSITGTWPIRTELSNRMIGKDTNALASSIVIVCRKRNNDAQTISRKQFLRELDETLPEALEDMIGGKEGTSPVAPVDLAQAAIGPGMAVFSKYAAVLEADGSPMTVHNALVIINKSIDEYFTHAESDMDADTRFCVDWFQQYGFKEGQFGQADVLARAKGTSVDGVKEAGVIEAAGGKVRLYKMSEYPSDWNPEKDKRIPVWEACHHLCRALLENETAAGVLLSHISAKAEPVRQLAYRLYTLCERNKWAQEAGIYNSLITSWHAIVEESRKNTKVPKQTTFL